MTTREADTAVGRGGGPVLVLTKLRPPGVRDGILRRESLVARLDLALASRLLLVACPAGFGKTTLLASWVAARADDRPVGWVSLDEGDNDPTVLWAHVIEAIRGVCPAVRVFAAPEDAGSAPLISRVLPLLVNSLTDQSPVTVVLDDYHRLTNPVSRDSVAWFLEHAPPTFRLVIATRSEPRLPLAVLRARGELAELRPDDLRFSLDEAEALLNGLLGLGLTAPDVESLFERTEGWPAGLYLAAKSLEGKSDRHEFVARFGASNRHVVDLLVDEVLNTHEPDMQTLMMRASILERISGPLCDALLESSGSATKLADLARSNLFLIPLDEEGEWYRFHRLFGQLLRVQLARREPGSEPGLHRRASAWHRDFGTTDDAVTHAIDAGDHAVAAELISAVWIRFCNACRHETVRGWLRRFPENAVHADPRLLLVHAWVSSICADRVEAARCILLIEGKDSDTLSDGPLLEGFASVESGLTLLKATIPWGDVGAMVDNGGRAAVLEPPGSPWYPVACWAIAVGSYLRGDLNGADGWFADSIFYGVPAGQWLTTTSALGYRSLIAGEHGRMDDQREHARRAVEMADQHRINGLVGIARVALGVSLAAGGRPGDALAPLQHGITTMEYRGQPPELANALLLLARVLKTVGDSEMLTLTIKQARSIIDSCPDPGAVGDRLAVLERHRPARSAQYGDELTERELEVLRLLSGPHAESDIAGTLFVSFNTVHTHIRAIYRKLRVSSRAEAIDHALSAGLLSEDLT